MDEPRRLDEKTIDRMKYEALFLKAVEEGRAAARRNDLLEHDEVVERMERMLGS